MTKRAYLWLAGAGLCNLAACSAPPQPATNVATFLQPPIETQGLIGSTPAILNAEFGEPSLRRVDGPAQVWLYHSPVCGLNLILYPDASGTPRVATAVPDNDDPVRCMQSLQRGTTTANLDRPASS
jgi:hypothetical protein